MQPASLPTGAGRFAPSTSGPPHIGTLASALLVWLDARQRGAKAILRLEDLDPQRAKAAFAEAICTSLQHLGLCFDAITYQSQHHKAHAQALDILAAQDALYACSCRRDAIARRAKMRLDGAYGYDHVCREQQLLRGGKWRHSPHAVRAKLPQGVITPVDTGGLDLQQNPGQMAGDPIVRRRDGSVAYVLASVVDDAYAQVGHIVRGADLAPLSATQVGLLQLLRLPIPTFRHHPVLLDASGRKWSKSRSSLAHSASWPAALPGSVRLGRLAWVLGLCPKPAPTTAAALLADFDWQRVIAHDVRVTELN